MAIMLTRPTAVLLIAILPAIIYLAFISSCLDASSIVAFLQTLLSLRFLIVFLFILSPNISISHFDGFEPCLVPAIMLRASFLYLSRVRHMIRVRRATRFRRIMNKCCKPLLCIKHHLIDFRQTYGDYLRIGLAGLLRRLADCLESPPDPNISIEADYRRLTVNLWVSIKTIAARESTIRSLTQQLADMEQSMFGMEADRKKERRKVEASTHNAEIQHQGQILLLETQAIIDKGNHEAEIAKKDGKLKVRKARLEHATTQLSEQGTQLLKQELQIGRQTSQIRAQNAQILQQEGFLDRFWNLDAELDTKTWELASCRTDLEISTSNIATLNASNAALTSRIGTLEALNSTLTSGVASLEAVIVTKTHVADAMTQLADQRGAALEETQSALVAQARAVRLEEANVRSKCRMLGRLNEKYDTLLNTVINADTIFNATVEGFEAQIASLKTDLASAVDCCQMMESALDEALAGEEEARYCVEGLEEALRRRVEAEHRVLRNLGIDVDSDRGDDSIQNVEAVDTAEDKTFEADDDALRGEGDVEFIAPAELSEYGVFMVQNTDHEELASAATSLAAYAEEPFEATTQSSSERSAISFQSDNLGPSQPPTTLVDTVQDRHGLDNYETQLSACETPRSRVLHTSLWLRRPLGIRTPEWEDTWWCGGQRDALALTVSTLDAELLASDVEVEHEVIMPSIDTATTVETGTDIEATAERTAPTPSPAAAPFYPTGEGFTDPTIEHLRLHDPAVPRFRRMMRDPPRARVLHTPLYSRRPLGIRRPEWVDTVLANGEQEVRVLMTSASKAESLRFDVTAADTLAPSRTYPRGILNAKGGLWKAPVHTTSRVTWSHEERMYYCPEDEPKVVACTDSEKHEVA